MRTTFRLLFYVKRNGKKSNGKSPIIARITLNKKQSEFNTKLEVTPEQWSVALGKMSGRTAESQDINTKLDAIKVRIHNTYHSLVLHKTAVTCEDIKNDFLGISEKHESLLVLFERHNADVKKQVGFGKSKVTYQKYEVTRKHLVLFMKSRYNLSDIALRDISPLFLSDFEIHLRTVGNCNSNTTAKFMQFFKRIVIIARNNGWIQADPFANYKITLKRVEREYLNEEELNRMLHKQFATNRLEQVRDIFIFSCYTGLAYIDVKSLTKDNVRTSFDGKLWIMTKRRKTDVQSNIPLLDVPLQLIAKYENQCQDKLLPVASNQKMNDYLKEIAAVCGITKPLSFHIARHTFATLTLSKGVSIESVSKMLGHTNIRTTQIYARITDKKVSDDMALFAQKLKEQPIAMSV